MRIVTAESLVHASPRRVLIAGGGYAGMTAAVTLAHRMRPGDGVEIVLVTPRPYQQALSELDLVAAGTPRPQFAELWHAAVFRGLPIKVCYERLENVDAARCAVSLGPEGAPTVEVPYWRLVIATGAVPMLPPVPGLADHALTMWSVPDALELQRRIGKQFGRASTQPEPETRRADLSITVIGGGATGVEIMGTIAAMLPRMIRRAGHDPSDLRLTLIEGRPDILYDLQPTQRERAKRRLRAMGVDVALGDMVSEIDGDVVRLASGRTIPSPVLVWCGGARADPDAANWGLEVDSSGRLLAEPTLKARGCDCAYVVGDVAAFRDPKTGRILPMLAQFAIREAAHAADNVLREARGEECRPFEPHQHGEFVSVGPTWGVGWMFGLNVSGWPAIVMKRLTYVMYWLQVGSFRLAWYRTRQMLAMLR